MSPVEPGQSFLVIVLLATVLGFAARKTGQPTVIAYAVTGIVLGPSLLGIVETTELISILSELGLAFLLFLIGLEIRLDDIKQILRPTLVIAVSQMALVGAVAFITAELLGFGFLESVFIAAASMYSSTAVVVKLLSDKDEISTLPGKLDVGMLLVEDVAVILLIAIIGAGATTLTQVSISVLEVAGLITVLGLISLLSSRYLIPLVFDEISGNEHAFFIHGVAWAFLLILVSESAGLSMEIGAFFAGLSLAQLPYRTEMMERVRPLTDFFMAVFFVTIGLKLTPGALTAYWKEAVLASGILMVAKSSIIFGLTDRMKFTPETSFKAAINKSQISEFALILGALGVAQGLISQGVLGFLSIVALLTMAASSYLIAYNDQLYNLFKPLLNRFDSESKTDVELTELEGHALVIGYDELSRRLLPLLETYFEQIVVIDRNPVNTEELAESDYEYIYGDFKHSEIRKASAIKKAGLVMSFAPDPWISRKVLEETGEESTVFVKATGMENAAELYDQGAHYVIIKNILAGDKMEEYLHLYLEDRELFMEEVRPDKQAIRWGGRTD